MYGIEINNKVNMKSSKSTTITGRCTSDAFMAEVP